MPTKSESSSSITMPNALTIRSIDGVKDFLVPLLNVGGTVVLEVGDDAQVDLSFVQLLEAARNHVRVQGGALRLSKPASGPLLEVLQRAGFTDGIPTDAAEFWYHREIAQ